MTRRFGAVSGASVKTNKTYLRRQKSVVGAAVFPHSRASSWPKVGDLAGNCFWCVSEFKKLDCACARCCKLLALSTAYFAFNWFLPLSLQQLLITIRSWRYTPRHYLNANYSQMTRDENPSVLVLLAFPSGIRSSWKFHLFEALNTSIYFTFYFTVFCGIFVFVHFWRAELKWKPVHKILTFPVRSKHQVKSQ